VDGSWSGVIFVRIGDRGVAEEKKLLRYSALNAIYTLDNILLYKDLLAIAVT